MRHVTATACSMACRAGSASFPARCWNCAGSPAHSAGVAHLPEPRPEPELGCPASTGIAHAPDPAQPQVGMQLGSATSALETEKGPGQYGCAARDSNPEPAD